MTPEATAKIIREATAVAVFRAVAGTGDTKLLRDDLDTRLTAQGHADGLINALAELGLTIRPARVSDLEKVTTPKLLEVYTRPAELLFDPRT